MTPKQDMSAIKNGVWNAGASITGILSGIIGSIFIVRNLSPVMYGQLSYYLWLMSIVGALGSLAFPVALTKIRSELIGQQKFEQHQRLTVFVFVSLFGVNVLLSIIFIIWWLSRAQNDVFIFLVITTTILPNTFFSLMRSTLWGSEIYKPVSVAMAIGSLVQLLSILLISWKNPVINLYFLALSAPIFVQFILLLAFLGCRKYILIKPEILGLPSRETLIRYVRYLLPATLIMFYTLIVWQRSEIFFLNRFSTKNELGFYNVSFTLYAIFSELGWALVNGYFPSLSRLFGSNNWTEISHEFSQALVIAAMYSIPISLGGIVVIDVLLPLVYGPKMIAAILPSRILFIGMVPVVITGVLNIALSTLGSVWYLAISGIVAALFNIFVDLLLIPQYGAFGASLANTASQILMFALLLILIKYRFILVIPWKQIMLLSVYGLLATFILPMVIVKTINIPWLNLLLAVMVAVTAYGLLLFSSKSFRPYILGIGLLIKKDASKGM